jgi:hypothetical protein
VAQHHPFSSRSGATPVSLDSVDGGFDSARVPCNPSPRVLLRYCVDLHQHPGSPRRAQMVQNEQFRPLRRLMAQHPEAKD